MDAKGPYRFTLEQLMELAGLAVAQATCHYAGDAVDRFVIACGPGNNGGDGLVAARHLALFYGPSVKVQMLVPKKNTKQPYFEALTAQALACGATVLDEMPPVEELRRDGVFIVDALFGFSFKGEPRPPFDDVIRAINAASAPMTAGIGAVPARVCCVDIPSGWDVDRGYVEGSGAIENPSMLVSLTLPKQGVAAAFSGSEGHTPLRHYLGGRFLPRAIAERYSVPSYPGFHQVVQLTVQHGGGGSNTAGSAAAATSSRPASNNNSNL